MSAITGILHFNNEPIPINHGKGLMKSLQKYPADDVKMWSTSHLFLGCHAQWITPESVGEVLPYFDPNRKLAITADAIIDNRDELFERLQVSHDKRKIISDSELILLSYYKWGEDSPKYLVGDFAFMIWDETKRKLFGARDFSGSRTLYYFLNQKLFAFCTTIEPLLSLPYVDKKLDEQWLAEFIAIAGMVDVVDSSLTAYKNIKQLPPSHSISILEDRVTLKQYCKLNSDEKLKLKNDNEYVEAFQEIFQEAVDSRLRTIRQVGAQLSGGLDSGSIVSFAAKTLQKENKSFHTFSYVPPQDFQDYTPRYIMPNETPLIKSTVNRIGGILDHYLDFEGRDPYTEVDDFLEIMEMPYKFFENSFWLKGMFEEAHGKGIGILLNGGRGNLSISWGPAIDYYALLLKRLKWIHLYKELNQFSRNVGGARLRSLPMITRVAFPIIDKISPIHNPYQLPTVISPDLAKRTNVFNKLKEYGMSHKDLLEATAYEQRKRHFEDLFHWNASNTIATKLSLKYSLWKRDPTNDLRVVRFCLSVPENQYVQNGMDRALIRRSTENFLPDEVRLNQRIRGVQGADWIHRMAPHWDIFIKELEHLLTDIRALEFFNKQVLEDALLEVKKGARSEYATHPNYKILMRSLIIYRFIKKFD
ncbi:lasso peptide isopeptide bond-forming cyclase [Metabacillus halosaccharovorans]|uniref:lasso peptide isopeptide bond-forming cyclase n=1 Tax=Metabacillus halosaccharovorans TaxID=930124 RepID=UPI0034CE658D